MTEYMADEVERSDDVLRGWFRYFRHGAKRVDRMSIETASWILTNDAGVLFGDGRPPFVSDRGTEFWWDRDKGFTQHAPTKLEGKQ